MGDDSEIVESESVISFDPSVLPDLNKAWQSEVLDLKGMVYLTSSGRERLMTVCKADSKIRIVSWEKQVRQKDTSDYEYAAVKFVQNNKRKSGYRIFKVDGITGQALV